MYIRNMTTTTSPATDQVARTIRAQIGDGAAMETGMRDLGFTADSLHFTLSDIKRRRVRVAVILDPSDTYTVRWGSPLPSAPAFQSVSGLYADHLPEVVRDIAARNMGGWLA